MYRKVPSVVIGLLLLLPAAATAQSADVQAQLAALLAQLAQLQQQLAQAQAQQAAQTPVVTTGGTIACPNPALTRSLSRGATGTDVAALQGFLINSGYLAAGNVTGFFGPLTEAALQRFQAAKGVVYSGTPDTTGYGYVGPKTRYAIVQACTTPLNPVTQIPVTPPPPPSTTQQNAVFTTFTAIPARVTYGQSSTLTWNVQNASGCVLSQQVPGMASVAVNVNLPVSGTAVVTPQQSIVYTIVCTAIGIQNQGAIQSVGVTVDGSAASTYPKLTVTATPSTITPGNSSTIAWNALNVSSCNLTSSPSVFSSNAISGSQSSVFNSVGTTTFTLTCVKDSQNYASSTQLVVKSIPNVVKATPATGTAPLYVTFTGTMGNTYNGSLKLDYGDGTNVIVCAAGAACTAFTTYHTYNTPGTYTPSLTVVAESGNTSLGSTSIVVSAPPVAGPTLTTNLTTYDIGDTVLATWNVPGATYANDWVTYVPQGTTWNVSTLPANQPKFITDGAHSWTKSLIPISTGTFELVYFSQDGYGVVVRSAPFVVKPLFFQLVPDRFTATPGSAITVTWKNPQTPTVKDWLTMVPSGAHYSSSTWPTNVFPNVYTGGGAAGSISLTAPQVPGQYELVYYSNDSFTELARSTTTIMVSGNSQYLTAAPSSGARPLTVTFTGSVNSAGYSVDYGDGTSSGDIVCGHGACPSSPTSSSVNVSHTYTVAGTYTAKLRQHYTSMQGNCAGADCNVVGTATITVSN